MQSVNTAVIAELTGCTEQHLLRRADGFLLHHKVLAAFDALCQAAQQEGISIKLVSAYRSFDRQAYIWNNKFSGKRPVFDMHDNVIDINTLQGKAKLEAILLYSALPGASRHHWGTDLDIYDAAAVAADYKVQLLPEEYNETGPFGPLALWLKQHAQQFGFFMPYRSYQGGVAAEPWHISYQPVASEYLQKLNTDVIRQSLLAYPIAGQDLVLDNLPWIIQQYVRNICSC